MNKEKFLSLVLASAIAGSSATAFSESAFKDIPDNWAKEGIEEAIKNQILKGHQGEIRPYDNLSRAELAAMVSRLLGLKEEGDLSGFKDMDSSKWYYKDMSRAVKAGVFKGDSQNKLNPSENISRQEVFVVMSRVLHLLEGDNKLEGYKDKGEIADWAKDATDALVSFGYIKGDSENKLNPRKNITRAEYATLLRNMTGELVQKPATVESKTVEGNMIVNSPNVNLSNTKIVGDLILAEGVGAGNINLSNVEVTGRILARSGKIISLEDKTRVKNFIVPEARELTVAIGKDSHVDRLETEAKLKLEGSGALDKLLLKKGSDGSEIAMEDLDIEVEDGVKDIVRPDSKKPEKPKETKPSKPKEDKKTEEREEDRELEDRPEEKPVEKPVEKPSKPEEKPEESIEDKILDLLEDIKKDVKDIGSELNKLEGEKARGVMGFRGASGRERKAASQKLVDLSEKLDGTEEKLEEIKKLLNKSNINNPAIGNILESIETSIKALNIKLGRLNSITQAVIEAEVSLEEDKIDEAKVEVEHLGQGQLKTELEARLENIDSKLLEGAISQIESRIESLTSLDSTEIDSIRQSITELGEEASDLNTKLDEKIAELRDKEEEEKKLKEEIDSFKTTHSSILDKTADTIAVEDEAELKSALEAYESLSDKAKEALKVQKLQLDNLEVKLENLKENQELEEAKSELRKKIGEAEKLGIDIASFSELLGSNNLSEIKSGIDQLETEIKEIDDKKVAKVVEDQITALVNITLDSKDAVEAARSAYDDLTEDQQKFVNNVNVLNQAEAKIEELEAEEVNKEAAKVVEDQIAALVDITLDSKDAVEAAREAYDDLIEDQKKLVENLGTLEKAESEIGRLEKLEKDKEEIGKVEDLISKLPEEITLDSKKAVESARKEYNSLTKEQKKSVENLGVLETAEAKIKELEAAKAKEELEKAEEERQAKVVEETLGKIEKAENLEALDAIEIDKTLSKENKASLLEAKNKKKVELEKAEADRQAKVVEETLGKINSVESLEDLEAIEIDESLSEENRTKLVEVKNKKKTELEQKEAERQAQIIEVTLEKINSVESLEDLEAIKIDESLSEENKASLEKAKEAKREKLEKAEKERQDKIVEETKKSIEEATNLEALEGIKIDESLSKDNKSKLEKAIEVKKVELKQKEADRQAKVVEETLGKINSVESLEDLEAIEIDENLSEENRTKLVEAKNKKKTELEQKEAERQAQIIEVTLEKINSVESLEDLEAIKIDESLSEENKASLKKAKEAKREKLEKAAELLKAKKEAISEVKKEYPEANYSKSKVEYNEAIGKINEAKSIGDIEPKKSESMDLISKLYTDSEVVEIEKIDGHLSSNMEATIKATNNQAKSKGFKVAYLYDDHKKIYEVAIDKSQETTSVLGTMGKGFATGLINPLTMGSKSGSAVNNIPVNLISNTVTALDDSGKFHEFDRNHLSNLTGDTKAFGVFMPEGQSASPFAKLKVLVGQSYSMEYKYKLSTGREYTNSIVIKFTNDYK